jgi:hypothetical protein
MERRSAGKTRGGVTILAGLAAGVAAGVALGSALLQRADRAPATPGRRPAATPPGQAGVAARPAVRRPPGLLDQLRARLTEAIEEGKVAAAEREAELEEQLARERQVPVAGSPPPVEGTARPVAPPQPPTTDQPASPGAAAPAPKND